MLSPAELFAVRSREQSLPQRTHGQKDFLPDGSQIQSEKLQICRAERWELLAEQHVERLGSLGSGVWKPEEELVQLTLPAGKFWQTMGFTEEGRQCLLPEEAVYLLECGTLQLFYRDLPLSVQEAYENLLSRGPVSLLHYQVYSHLKRLGYIVTRFDPSVIELPYERRINLESHVASSRKRKRNSRHGLGTQNALETSGTDSKGESKPSKSKISHCSETVAAFTPEPMTFVPTILEDRKVDDVKSNSNQLESKKSAHDEESKSFEGPTKSQRTYRWDFSKISFPNCAYDQKCLQLPNPQPAFLPDNVIGHQVDISPWLGKLNLRTEKFSRREQEQLDWERKYKSSINADPKIKKCCNWSEYKKLMQERECQSHRERPAHLWSGTVRPLLTPTHVQSTGEDKGGNNLGSQTDVYVHPDQCREEEDHADYKAKPCPFYKYGGKYVKATPPNPSHDHTLMSRFGAPRETFASKACVLEQVTVITRSTMLEDGKRLQDTPNTPQMHFNLYHSDGNSEFKKSHPGKPYAYLCVRSFDEQIPSLRTMKSLAYRCGDVPVVFALVDCGEVAFYTFKDFQLPVDVYP